MNSKLTQNQDLLLNILKISLYKYPKNINPQDAKNIGLFYKNLLKDSSVYKKLINADWNQLISSADKHGVLSVMYEVLSQVNSICDYNKITDNSALYIKSVSQKIVAQNYRLLHMSGYIINILNENDIPAILLKGWHMANYYPIAESRKSGDIDILIPDTDKFTQTIDILLQNGFYVKSEQAADYHVELAGEKGIIIEIHSKLTGDFSDTKINRSLDIIKNEFKFNYLKKQILGYTINYAGDAYNAFYLLIHMLHHFLQSGFGLRLLCDWVVFWNNEISHEDKQKYMHLVKMCKITGFCEAVTGICIKFLGLDYRKVAFMFEDHAAQQDMSVSEYMHTKKYNNICTEFILEILESEEFGKSSDERLVALRNSKPSAYIKEFHHQMKLNHPKSSKCPLLWPFLWIVTLYVFMKNNRNIRKTSTKKVLKSAAIRGKIVNKMNLFKR